jgi:hypothetical protein
VRVGPDGLSSVPRAISDGEISAARVGPSTTPTKRSGAAYLVAAAAAVCLLGGLLGSRRARRVTSPM